MKKILALLMAIACLFTCALAETADRVPASYTYNLADEETKAFADAYIECACYTYNLADEETLYLENLIFNGDVVIGGGNGMIMFANCEFNGDVVQTSETSCRAMILPDCTVNGRFVLRNSIQETTLDAPFPKIMSYVPAEVIAEDCFGLFLSLGGFDVVFNGETYTMADSDVFFDNNNPDQGMVPYEGQEANLFWIAQWWENGEQNILMECEYDPTI